jgi:hypothetical protein
VPEKSTRNELDYADCSQIQLWPCKTYNGQYNSVDLAPCHTCKVLDREGLLWPRILFPSPN